MDTLIVAALSFIGFIVAYHTYGRWLGRKIFRLDPNTTTPARQINDGSDFVATRKGIVFGHHFTSIAGTGPIVGPAIAVFWGWLPALLWVVFGSVFIGAVHDFGALVVSLRNRGVSIGEVSGQVISRRARLLVLAVLLLELTIVLAVFGLVIASIFAFYPGSVLAVWVSLPLAVALGVWIRKGRRGQLALSLVALGVIYLMIYVGITSRPVEITKLLGLGNIAAPALQPYLTPTVVWTVILFIYCFVASVLPVWVLLQPRDYVNSQQLFISLGLTVVGLLLAGATGQAHLSSAPAIASGSELPPDAPPLLPFLFITIACGAVSGFHSMVSSGTSSKQLHRETDATLVGYGSMLTEAALAVVVIMACCAGVGMARYERVYADPARATFTLQPTTHPQTGEPVTGRSAWRAMYHVTVTDPKTGRTVGGWGGLGLRSKLEAFTNGGANFLHTLGIPLQFGGMMLGVMVACFAATTLDTATRLQRYVIQELGETIRLPALKNKYLATAIAVLGGLAVAIFAGKVPGAGGLILWPLFGATNQVLAGLGFIVIAYFLLRRGRPVWFLLLPAALMIVLPAWAMLWNMFDPTAGWLAKQQWLLLVFGLAVQGLVVWLVVEAVIAYRKARQEGMLGRSASPLRESTAD